MQKPYKTRLIKFNTFLISLLLSLSISATLYLVPTPPAVKDHIKHTVIDAYSYKVLAAKNAHKTQEIASLTKLMTAYVAFKRIKMGFANLDDLVEISNKAYKTGGSRSFIERGEQISLRILLQGMIIQSGNDASVAIAEHIAGDEETFVKFMNHYANELGMKNTQYENSSGLPDKEHYSTAYDVGIISVAIIKEFPKYYQWFKQKEFTHNNIPQKNRNSMLWKDKTIDGLKTGVTEAAGYCLAISAKRNDMRLVSVVLGAKSKRERVKISKKLLAYSFRFYETQLLMKKNEVLAKIDVNSGEENEIKIGSLTDIYITLPRGQFKTVQQSIKLPKEVIAPIKQNQPLGELIIKIDGGSIVSYPLYTLETINKSTGFNALIDRIKGLF